MSLLHETDFDVAVIGAGPAGMACAIRCSELGLKTALFERSSTVGGILNQCIHNGFGLDYFKEELTGPEYAFRFAEKLKQTKVSLFLNTFIKSVENVEGGENGKAGICFSELCACSETEEKIYRCRCVVLATGCRERTAAQISLCGTRPSGIITAGLAQKMVNMHGLLPGKNIVILGSGDVGLIMARRLTLSGCKVQMVLEVQSKSTGLERNIQQCLNDFNIPLLLSTTVTRVAGKARVEGVYIADVDENWKPKPGTERFIECDTLLLSVGLIPENSIVKNLEINPKTNGALVNEKNETNLKHIYSCGNCLLVHDLADKASTGAEQVAETIFKELK